MGFRYVHDLTRLSAADLDDLEREARSLLARPPNPHAGIDARDFAEAMTHLIDEVRRLRGYAGA